MELIVFATKNILNKKIIVKLKNNYSKIIFIKKNEINNFSYNKNSDDKVIFIDPYFFDWKLPKNFFKNIKNIKCVCVTTTTASFIDEEYLRKNKIKLLTTFNYSTQSVAEYLIFMMFCLAKKLPLQLKNGGVQEHSKKLLQTELSGKCVGVVGFGNIGKRVCELTHGLNMKPVYWNRTKKKSSFKIHSLKYIFSHCDVIFITLADNIETKKIITKELLLSMKKTAILVSGTGLALLNKNVIKIMLKNNKLYGFGAEVPNKDINLFEGNANITSEYAWYTNNALKNREKIIEKLLLSIK